jgi:hypothetical protein
MQHSTEEASTEESFDHSSANDLAGLLEMYARPDRRVLERRSQMPASAPVDPNDRRVSDRRSDEPGAPASIPEGSDRAGEAA